MYAREGLLHWHRLHASGDVHMLPGPGLLTAGLAEDSRLILA